MDKQHCCRCMEGYTRDEDEVIFYVPQFDEYGIPVHDGSGTANSYIQIRYCPWCGERLHESRRGEWFEKLEALGFDDPFSEEIPAPFRTDEWYRGR